MLTAIFIFLLLFYLGFFVYAVYQLFGSDRYIYLLIFLIFYLPVYTTFQAIFYSAIGSEVALVAWMLLKELSLLIVLFHFALKLRDPLSRRLSLMSIDGLLLAFLTLAFIYMLMPLGDAGLGDKVLYFKNLMLPGVMYFWARNSILPRRDEKLLLISLAILLSCAFTVNLFEGLSGTHLQKLIEYERFQFEVRETSPLGFYGLGWNFENGPNNPRFSGIYANTVESGASAIMLFAMAFYWFWHTRIRENQIVFGLAMGAAWYCNYASGSRAALVGLIMAIFIIAVMLRYYRIIGGVMLTVLFFGIYVFYFAADELRYFVVDTITFQEASSFGHLLEWLEGVESMASNPEGIGLAMSGNSGGVEDDLKIGGENQFIVFGVQLGILGLLLYVLLLGESIRISMKTYQRTRGIFERFFPFVAATTKFGILLTLFTSNAETFLFLSYFSWWIVGYSMRQYDQQNMQDVRLLNSGRGSK